MSSLSSRSGQSTSATPHAADDHVVQLALAHGLVTYEQVARARDTIAEHSDLTVAPPRLLDTLVAEAGFDLQRIAGLLAAEFGLPLAPDLGTLRVSGEGAGPRSPGFGGPLPGFAVCPRGQNIASRRRRSAGYGGRR